MSDSDETARLFEIVFGAAPGALTPEQQSVMLCEALTEIRDFAMELSAGNLRSDISVRGSTAGALKALASNLRHLTWQASAIAGGDLTQRVDFLGEFSDAFNGMTEQLDSTLSALRARERELADANAGLVLAHAQLLEQATHDPLTGLLNRRSLTERWAAEKARADRTGEPICVIVADLDKFKEVNDTWGHEAGDTVLIAFAKVMTRSLRTSDLVFRTGGDEFLILLPSTDSDDCLMVATRVRDAFAQYDLGQALSEYAHTGSFGVAEYPKHGASLDELIARADEALYRVKAGGRNHVVVAD